MTCTGEPILGDPQHSYHNIEWAGFEPMFVRENWIRDERSSGGSRMNERLVDDATEDTLPTAQGGSDQLENAGVSMTRRRPSGPNPSISIASASYAS